MIVLSNLTAQTLAPGASLVLDNVLLNTGCNCCHRDGSSSIKIRRPGNYLISFSGNIGSTTETTEASLVLALGGENIPETQMLSVSVAAGDLNNVSVTTGLHVCCRDYDRLTVVNNGTTPVNVDSRSVLVITRVEEGC